MKDKEWLKEEIGELPCVDAVFNSDGSSYIDSVVPVLAVYDLIDQLDEPETLSQEWIEEKRETVFNHGIGTHEDYIHVNKLQNLLVPKQELPVIPQFVADWIDKYQKYEDVYTALSDGFEGLGSAEVYNWLHGYEGVGNQELFARAWLDGYTIEKEKLYKVELPINQPNHILTIHADGSGHFFGKEHMNNYWYKTHLTEREIKAIDERFWAFAVPVEEEEE